MRKGACAGVGKSNNNGFEDILVSLFCPTCDAKPCECCAPVSTLVIIH